MDRFWSESECGLRIISLDDGSTTQLTTGFDNFLARSPNGDLSALTRFSEGDFDIYTIRPDGTGLRRLTTTSGNHAHEIWSPDGEHIRFSGARFGLKEEGAFYGHIPQPQAELFVMNADGSGQWSLADNKWEDGTQPGHPHPSPSFQVEYYMQCKNRHFHRASGVAPGGWWANLKQYLPVG